MLTAAGMKVATVSLATAVMLAFFVPSPAVAKGSPIASLEERVAALETLLDEVQQQVADAATVDTFTYDLAPGESSAPITVPDLDSPVSVTANCVVVGRRGVAQVTIQRTSVAPLFLQWVGISSPAGPTVVGDWWPGGLSPHIAWIDFAHQVELLVISESQFVVRNNIPIGGARATGTVKLIQ